MLSNPRYPTRTVKNVGTVPFFLSLSPLQCWISPSGSERHAMNATLEEGWLHAILGSFSTNERRLQRERHKTIGLMNRKKSLCTCGFFLYISFLSSAKQQREMTKFKVLWRTWAHDGEFFILLPYLNAIHINLVPGYYAYIVERIGIIAK